MPTPTYDDVLTRIDRLLGEARGGLADKLRAKLLSLGGTDVDRDMPSDPDLPEIVASGKVWPHRGAVFKRGKPVNCHANVARLCLQDEGVIPVTGYALSADGLWRSHSWAVKDGRVIETTQRRVGYFGVEVPRVSWIRRQLGNRVYIPGEPHWSMTEADSLR